ncbi:LAGLIDADG family homing endonuclease [Streptomyces sp. NPDC094153]|uniref:LAGLIDADG family homing endonuclease n=1 Tax=Streptomyces sp. NPDC094153 TaxID=3366058 RepID=UPI0037F49D1F
MIDFLEQAADRLEVEADRQRTADVYAKNPAAWASDKLGEHFWSKQVQIAESVRDNRLTAVQSCHGTGKSFTVSRLTAWWLDIHPPGEARVVTTAPTGDQVKAILWSEINGAFAKAQARGNPFIGRVNETEWKLDKRLLAFGRKPSDYNPHAFQGIHAKYVLVILDEACHDDQTEVMTEFGWRRFSELDGTERLLTMDPETHAASYRVPDRLVAYPYRGKMYSYAAKGANFCVTPNHDMYFRGRHGRYGEHRWEWRKEQMQELAHEHNKFMLKAINWAQEDIKEHVIPECVGERKTMPALTVPMDDWMVFLGWYCSEGHVIKKRGRAYGIGISQQDPTVLADIHDLCLRLGLPAKLYPNQVHIHSMQLGRHLAELGPNCIEKHIPDYARMASARQIGLFLDAFARGDGYRKGKGEILYTSSPRMADALQEMILKTGMPSVVRKREMTGRRSYLGTHVATSSADGYVITRPHQASDIKYLPNNVELIDYDGMVYCAEVSPEHLLFTRRNGYTLWSGNCGINKQFWTAANAIATGEHCRIVAVGNPDDPGSYFARACASGRWNVIRISAFDSPNFTDELVPDDVRPMLVSQAYVDDMKAEFGEQSPTYISKVLGEFPSDADDGVVRLSAIRACAQPRDTEPEQDGPVELGVDLGAGGDETCIRERRGPLVGREWRTREKDPVKVVAKILEVIRETGATTVKVDSIGIGWGIVGSLREKREQGMHAADILGVNVSEKSSQPDKYARLRSQIWWEIGRQLSEDGAWDLSKLDEDDRERLVTQLTAPKYTLDSSGRIVVEPKEDTKKRIGRSPDNADALLLAFYAAPGGFNEAMDYLSAMRAA